MGAGDQIKVVLPLLLFIMFNLITNRQSILIDLKKKKTYKIKYLGPNTWRQVFLHLSSEVIEEQDKFIRERSSTITPILTENTLKVYNGKSYIARSFSNYAVGFKFGEFTWNRKIALYKAKQLRSKKKKKK